MLVDCVYGLNIMIIHTHTQTHIRVLRLRFKCPLGPICFCFIDLDFSYSLSRSQYSNISILNVIVVVVGGLFLGVRPRYVSLLQRRHTHIHTNAYHVSTRRCCKFYFVLLFTISLSHRDLKYILIYLY